MNFTTTNISCGIRQLHGLGLFYGETLQQSLREAVRSLKSEQTDSEFSIIVFSDNTATDGTPNPRVRALLEFIEKNDLGDVQVSNVVVNRNTANPIRIWTWYVNWNSKMWKKLWRGR
jgi:hypothetical protein